MYPHIQESDIYMAKDDNSEELRQSPNPWTQRKDGETKPERKVSL